MTTSTSLDAAGAVVPCVTKPTPFQRVAARWHSPSFQHSILSVTDQAVVSGTSFASSVLIGRSCSQDELGVYSLALSLLLLARGIQGDLVSGPYLVYCHRRQHAALARYTGSSLIHQAAITLITVFAMVGLAAGISQGGGSQGVVAAVMSLVVAVPFVLLREHLRQLSFAQLRVWEALQLDVVVASIQLGVVGLLAWQGALTVIAVYVAMAAGCGLACLGWLITKPDAVVFNLSAAWTDWRSNWTFGRWTLASQLISRAMSYLAPWLIAWTHGKAETGVMAANMTVVNLAGMFVTGVSNSLTPRAARAYVDGGEASLRAVLVESLVLFLTTIGGFCVFIALTGDSLITFVYGDRFAGTSVVLFLLALQMMANSIGIVAGNGLWAMDQPRANFQADVMTLLVTGGVLAAAVPGCGVTGAALGLLIGTTVGTVTRIWVLFQIWRRTVLTVGSGAREAEVP